MSDQNEFMDQAVLIETIENQLADGEPIKVKETLMRLVMTGASQQDAKEMMACALAIEVFDVMKNGAKFDQKRYAQHLDLLPDLGFMEGE
ncbi:hypothetical protein [Vibrio sp. MA40-2]|uniref:hypothetical protein n=1 Tax=Vibrio sp. MA40-2 TaxID=3391828 RepID=UPI0039A52B45